MIKKLFFIAFIFISAKVFATEYYVSTTGNNSNKGDDINKPWKTISYAATKAKAGDTVWIKAGNYGNENIVIKNKGKEGSPISFIGYKNITGDITSRYYTYAKGKPLNSDEMPFLDGGNRAQNTGLKISSKEFIIIKNLQISNYELGIFTSNVRNLTLDNIIAKTFGNVTKYSGRGIHVDGSNNLIRNCLVINSAAANITLYGNNNILEFSKSFSDELTGGHDISTDYYIIMRGSHNIVRNCYIERVGNLKHFGHGMSVKSAGYKTENNLIENLEIVGIKLSIEARFSEVKYNTFRNIKVWRRNTHEKGRTGGIAILNGASYNVFENITVDNTSFGIYFTSGNEYRKAPTSGNNNIFKNCIFSNNTFGIRIDEDGSGQNRKIYNNQILNSNFYNNKYQYLNKSNDSYDNLIINCNITDTSVKELYNNNIDPGFIYRFSNFFDNSSFDTPVNNGNVSYNPGYMDPIKLDFRLKDTSEIKDKGEDLSASPWRRPDGIEEKGVTKDAEGKLRTVKFSIGAYEKDDNSTGTIEADAGPNTTICVGETATLTATGGTSYSWNTGETTASITVNPLETTTYKVTVSDGANSDTDEVIVTVNDLPSVNAGADVTICSGENTTLTANGTGNFLWSTGETTASITVSPTSTTTYTVTVSNSCTDDATDQVIVNVTPGVNLALDSDAEICLGESITLTAQSNGDFLWNTGETTASITVSPASTTIYSVTSSLGVCSKSEEVSVTVNQAPSVNAGLDQTICLGENITLTASGTGNFLWSTGETTSSIEVSPFSTTAFTVTASNSCSEDATDQILVKVNDKPIMTVSEDVTIESGASTVLTAIGNGDFLWSTGETSSSITVSPSASTIFTVTLISPEGCSVEDNVEVIVDDTSTPDNSETTLNADAGEDVYACLNSNTVLTASGGGLYLWNTGEVTETITVSPTETTTYYVTVSDGINIDITDVDEVTVYVDDNCSDIANRPAIEEFKVYPNPTNGILYMELSGYSNELNLSLFSSTGKIIHSEIISNYSLDKALKRNINLRKFGKGIYYARIVNNDKNETKKVIVM